MAHTEKKEAQEKIPELTDISRAIDLLCVLNINDLKNTLRPYEGGLLGVVCNKQFINIEKIASALPRHLLAHIVMGHRGFPHHTSRSPTSNAAPSASSGATTTAWLAYTAKGLHLINCLVGLEYLHPRLSALLRGLEHRSLVLDLLLLAGAVWNTELAGATTFQHYVLCAEGIRLTSAALGTALQMDLDRGATDNNNTNGVRTASITRPNSDNNNNYNNNVSNDATNNNNGLQPNNKNINGAPPNAPYLYEWYDALIIHPKLNTFISLPIDAINLLQTVTYRSLQSSPDHAVKLCRSFHTQLEAFYLMCCSEEFVGQMLVHPIFLSGELLDILQQSLNLGKCTWTGGKPNAALTASGDIQAGASPHTFQQGDPISSVVHQVLRVLYVLFEKESPCFLDAVAGSPSAFHHAQSIISSVTSMATNILDTKTCSPSAIESFKIVEILSDDSNFKNEVIARSTPFILRLLSLPPPSVSALFDLPIPPSSPPPPVQTAEQLQKDFMILLFRIVGNLHCFNEAVCKAEDKGMFLRTVVAEISKHSPASEKSDIQPTRVLENLNFLLYRLSKENHIYHLNTEELDLVTSFTHALQKSLALSSPSGGGVSGSEGDNGDHVSTSLVNHKRKHLDTVAVQ